MATLPGLDGRKMSKSYGNTIPLFAPRAQLQKQIASIVTDSRAPGEPKDTEGSALFQIYQAFADEHETEALRKAYAEGIGWGDAKQLLFERIDREITPMREQYEALLKDPARIETTLLAGAAKARALSQPFMGRLRHAVGLRNLGARAARPPASQVREDDRPARASSNTARATASSISSCWTRAANCCCRAWHSPRRRKPAKPSACCSANAAQALATLADRLPPLVAGSRRRSRRSARYLGRSKRR